MDYHAWFVLEKSLGILDYGSNFNSAIVTRDKDCGLIPAINKLWNRIHNRHSEAEKGFEVKPISSRETCCRA